MQSKPSILHIIHGLTTGGAEIDLLNKCIYLTRAHQYQMTICCLMRVGELAEQFEKNGIAVIGPLMRHRYDILAGVKLRRLLSEPHWDIVHSHLSAANLITWLVNLTNPASKRLSQVAGEHAMAERWPRWVQQAIRQMGRDGVPLLVPSDAMVEGYLAIGIPSNCINVVRNGIDTERFQPAVQQKRRELIRQRLGISKGQFVIGTICRLAEVKNLPLLFATVANLLHSTQSLQLFVVGEGPSRQMLEALIETKEWEKWIHLLGNRTDIADLLIAFDLFVLPSLSESFGIAVAEALLMEVPVVATAVGGIPEITGNGAYAQLVAPRDEQALSMAIQQVIIEYEQAQQMARNGRAFVDTTLQIAPCAETLHTIYTNELAKNLYE